MSAIVFLGPSLPRTIARKIVNADFRPPAQMGDVYAAAQTHPSAIAILDGCFVDRPAVRHTEILFALSRGVRVIGGAGLGALLAAELHTFGMEGIGGIFTDFAAGSLEDDDEIAVTHAAVEAEFQPYSVALVNLRHGLGLAAARGVISAASRGALERAAKSAFYAERSWAALEASAPALGIERREIAALRAFVENERPDRQRDDALAILAALREDAPGAAPTTAAFTLEPTLHWDRLCSMWERAETPSSRSTPPVAAGRVRDHVRLADPARERIRRLALLLVLAREAAGRNGIGAADERLALERFRRERDLVFLATYHEWLTAQHASNDDAVELAQLEALVRALEHDYAARVDAMLPTALRLEGRYGDAVARVRAKWSALAARGVDEPSLAATGLSLDELLAWYQRRSGPLRAGIEEHAAELGFAWPGPFIAELAACYLGEAAVDGAARGCAAAPIVSRTGVDRDGSDGSES